MNTKLNKLITAMDEYGQLEHNVEVHALKDYGSVVAISIIDKSAGTQQNAVIADVGAWKFTRELVEVDAPRADGMPTTIVSAIPSMVLACLLE